MNEIIEIKRKEFEVLEQMGDRSYKRKEKVIYTLLRNLIMMSKALKNS